MERFCKYVGITREEHDDFVGNFIAKCSLNEKEKPLGNDWVEDEFGVVFDRTFDEDIGVIHEYRILEPDIGDIWLRLETQNHWVYFLGFYYEVRPV